jgi:hypothetical protein
MRKDDNESAKLPERKQVGSSRPTPWERNPAPDIDFQEQDLANALNARGITTARGGQWRDDAKSALLKRQPRPCTDDGE